MTINKQQKNIVNPFALIWADSMGYNYSDYRNKFVLDVIHDACVNYYMFLPQDQVIELSVEDLQALRIEKDTPNLKITKVDLQAYNTLYPQNSIIVEISNKIKLEMPSAEKSNQELLTLVTRLEQIRAIDKYTSNSTPSSLLPENVNNLGPAGLASRLIAIPSLHSNEYLALMRSSVGLENQISLDSLESIENFSMSTVATSFVSSDNNVDIYDWRANCGPGTDTNKVYYNTIDDKFYFTARTDIASTRTFDMSYWRSSDEAARVVLKAVREGLAGVLKFTGKYSDENLTRLVNIGLDSESINFISHLDPRPGSRWIHAVRVKRSVIRPLDAGSGPTIAYDEFEKTPLEKAQILINPEAVPPVHRKFVRVANLIRYIPRVVSSVREYSIQLKEEGINPEDIQGINLNQEATRLDSFIDMLSLAYIYNKFTLNDDDVVEFVFSEEYKLKYFVVNGFIMTRGIGNKTFYGTQENEETPRKILNAFSLLSPTTFSLIKSSYEIYSDESLRAEDSRLPWPDFFKEYIYPAVQLSPKKIREKAEESLLNFRLLRRQKLYTKIINLNKEGNEIIENLKRRNKNKYPFYQITTILSDMGGGDCNTAQAQALGDVLRFWQNISGKSKMRSLLRQAILLARDELIKDEVTKAYLSDSLRAGLNNPDDPLGDAARAMDNPRLYIREIEKRINQEIFCGLDVMGNVIETQILDPKNMSPELDASGKPPGIGFPLTIDLKVPKGLQGFTKSKHQRQTELYEEMVIQIILGFIKSIALGIVKDVIKASLGCGPDGPDQDTLEDVLKDLRYGFLDLNEYLSDIDIVEIAKEANLYNMRGNEKTDPTFTQVQTFIKDVSYMCTPSELDRLTFGDGDNTLYELILETVQDGVITFPADPNTDPEDEANETRTIDPTVYGDIKFSVEKIQDFFIKLGDKMRDENAEELAKFTFSPLEAYCAGRETSLDTLGLDISKEQLESQYISLAQDKIAKINTMCDWLRGLENIEIKILELINSLPIMEGYNEILQTIAEFSEALWQTIADLWDKLFSEPPKDAEDPTFNLYTTAIGQDLFYSVRKLISQRIMVAQARAMKDGFFSYRAPAPAWRVGHKRSRVNLPYPAPEKLKDPWFSYWDVFSDIDDQEASYSVRTAPTPLRNDLVEITQEEGNGDLPVLYEKLHKKLMQYFDEQNEVVPPDQYLYGGGFPYCFMVSSNPSDGGIRVLTNIKKKKESPAPGENPFERRWKILSEYRPQPGDTEEGVGNIDYHRLFSGIRSRQVGGEFTGGPLVEGEFAESEETPLMPPRANKLVNHLVNNVMHGVISWRLVYGSVGNRLADDMIVPSGVVETDTSPNQDTPVTAFTETDSKLGGNRDSMSIGNYTEFIDEQINDQYIRSDKRSGLLAYIRATNKPPFIVNDDVCVTNEEVMIAQSIVMCIQSRLQYFFMNVVPLTRVYPHWNSLATRKMIDDYLYRKILEELENKSLTYLMYDKALVLQKVFGDVPENNLHFSDIQTPKDFIKELIGKTYDSMLNIIANDGATNSSGINKSIFADPEARVTLNRYERVLLAFYKELQLGLEAEPESFDLTVDQATAAITFISETLTEKIGDTDTYRLTQKGYEYGTYYLPLAPFIGLYLISYDRVVDLTKRFKSGRVRTQIEISAADDSLLSNLTEQVVTKYQDEIQRYPVPVVTWEGIEVMYYTNQDVLDRIEVLEATIYNEWSSVLRRTWPEFFARWGGIDTPREVFETVTFAAQNVYWKYQQNPPQAELTLRNVAATIMGMFSQDYTPVIGEEDYKYYVALQFVNGLRNGSLSPSFEEVFEDLANFATLNPKAEGNNYNLYKRRQQAPDEKRRLEALLIS